MAVRQAKYFLEDIKTVNPDMQKIKAMIQRVAPSEATVLIIGESGVGKELIASALHNESGRPGEFVAVNCAAVPDGLWESEFFGYEEGAFTGACRKGKAGIVERAHMGTLFLDEVAEIPWPLQAKLLRVLQEKEVTRVGGHRRRQVDVRVVAATNRDLASMVEKGAFRRDLYYRLSVIPILVPPLRDRPDDILYLGEYFLRYYEGKSGKKFAGFTNRLKRFFLSYNWPGNVRELANCIEFAVSLEDGGRIDLDSLPHPLKEVAREWQERNKPEKCNGYNDYEEKLQILRVLNKHGWTVEGKKKAARELGISLATLYRRLKIHNICF
ncbi:hypothetical protein TAMC210_09800 [Thermanaeromonas sp. C210]|nr:hypothetical protein TAMC210_09800 [Thermanaeromonas sp. C210]